MATKIKDALDIPIPSLPKSLLPANDSQHEDPVMLKPEDTRARMQLLAGLSLDILEWHARNLSDPKMSQEACRDLLDRAGYVAPAKAKADGLPGFNGVGGEVVPSMEEEVKGMAESFGRMTEEEKPLTSGT